MKKALLAILLFLCFQPVGVFSNEENPYHDLNLFYQRVWSPYCKGNSLLECPSSQAQELRDELKKQYNAGSDFTQLEVFLKSVYGNQVRMEPQRSFRGMLAYWIPWLAFILAAVFVSLYWRRRTRPLSQNRSDAPETLSKQKTKSESEFDSEIEKEIAERLS